MQRKQRFGWTIVGVMLFTTRAYAASMGIPLDSFLGTFQTWVIGLGLLVGLVGLTGYVASQFDNPFGNMLAGSVGVFLKAGLLGGGTTLLSLVGLVGGAVL